VGPRVGLDGYGKSRPPTGIRSPDRPGGNESLYRLRYPGAPRSDVTVDNRAHVDMAFFNHNNS